MSLILRNIFKSNKNGINYIVRRQKNLTQIEQIRAMKTRNTELPPQTIQFASNKDMDSIMRFLDQNYFRDEPLIVGARLPEESLRKLRARIHAYANQGDTIMITDPRKNIMGVAINTTYPSWVINRESTVIDQQTCHKLQCYYDLLYRVQLRANLFRRFSCNYCFHCLLICVHRNYRRKGLAKQLYLRSRNIAKDRRFNLIRVDSTNHYLSVMCSYLKMDLVYEMQYKNFRDLYGNASFRGIPKPHHCLRVFIEPIVCNKKKY